MSEETKFEGEGNPSDPSYGGGVDDLEGSGGDSVPGLMVRLSDAERAALAAVLERETTSRPSYEGLRQLLSLSHPLSEALLGLLRRI